MEIVKMKRALCILTSLLLMFSLMPVALAQGTGFTEEQFIALLGEDAIMPGFTRLRLVGDTFYSLEDDGGIYAWNIHEDSVSLFCRVNLFDNDIPYGLLPIDKKEKAQTAVTHLFSGDEQLWAYNILSGRAGIINANGVNWGPSGEIKDENWNPRQYGDILGGFALGDHLYFAYEDSYFRLDPASGTGESYLLPVNASVFQLYKEGKAIIWSFDDVSFSIYEINLLDGESKQIKHQLPDDEMIVGLDYMAESDILYLMTLNSEGSNKVYISRQGANFEYQGDLLENGRFLNLNENEYALIQASGISINRTDELFQTRKRILTIRGILSFPYATQYFMRDNPDVVIREQTVNFEQQDLLSMISGDSNVDIYAMFTNRLFKAVKEKGYAMELDASDTLAQKAGMMHDVFYKAIKDEDGTIVAWPAPFIVYKLMAIDSVLWRECFGERPFPMTFVEMFEAMSEWESECSGQYEDAVVYMPGTLRSLLFHMVFKYISMYEMQNGWVDFDTPIFRESFSAYEEMLDSIDMERIKSILDHEDEYNRVRALFWGEGLYAENNNFFNPDPSVYFSAWPVFEAGCSPVTEVSFVVLWINRNSSNKDIAIKYIESLTSQENTSSNYEYALFKGQSQKVERADYLEKTQALNDKKAELKRAMAAVEEASKQYFEQAINAVNSEIEGMEANRYLITDEGISRYAAWVDQLKATSESNYLSQNDADDEFSKELGRLCDMFVQGAINRDMFISQLSNVSRLIYFERIVE